VIYVNASQTNNVPDGASRSTAFETVQGANFAASYGDATGIAAGADLQLTKVSGISQQGDIS